MEKKIEFKSGKNILRGSLSIPEGEGIFPGVIFFHGSRSNRERGSSIAKDLAKVGIIGLSFDISGHGESDGKYEDLIFSDLVKDAETALAFLKEQIQIDPSRIGLRGASMGGYMAACLSLNSGIKSLLLSVPAAFGYSEIKLIESEKRGKKFLNDPSNWSKSESLKAIVDFKGSLLVIRNELDELLSSEMVESYYNKAQKAEKKELFILKGVKHSTHDNPEALKIQHDITIDWFKKTL